MKKARESDMGRKPPKLPVLGSETHLELRYYYKACPYELGGHRGQYWKIWQLSTRSHTCKQALVVHARMQSLRKHSMVNMRSTKSVSLILRCPLKTMTTHMQIWFLCMNLLFKIKILCMHLPYFPVWTGGMCSPPPTFSQICM